MQVDVLDGETLVTLAELLIKGVKNSHHQALDLFPKLLSAIAAKKTIYYRKGVSNGSGVWPWGVVPLYVDSTHLLLHREWHKG